MSVETATVEDISVELSVNAGDVVDKVIDSAVVACVVTASLVVVVVSISIWKINVNSTM